MEKTKYVTRLDFIRLKQQMFGYCAFFSSIFATISFIGLSIKFGEKHAETIIEFTESIKLVAIGVKIILNLLM